MFLYGIKIKSAKHFIARLLKKGYVELPGSKTLGIRDYLKTHNGILTDVYRIKTSRPYEARRRLAIDHPAGRERLEEFINSLGQFQKKNADFRPLLLRHRTFLQEIRVHHAGRFFYDLSIGDGTRDRKIYWKLLKMLDETSEHHAVKMSGGAPGSGRRKLTAEDHKRRAQRYKELLKLAQSHKDAAPNPDFSNAIEKEYCLPPGVFLEFLKTNPVPSRWARKHAK